jgi:hypothetical protein
MSDECTCPTELEQATQTLIEIDTSSSSDGWYWYEEEGDYIGYGKFDDCDLVDSE